MQLSSPQRLNPILVVGLLLHSSKTAALAMYSTTALLIFVTTASCAYGAAKYKTQLEFVGNTNGVNLDIDGKTLAPTFQWNKFQYTGKSQSLWDGAQPINSVQPLAKVTLVSDEPLTEYTWQDTINGAKFRLPLQLKSTLDKSMPDYIHTLANLVSADQYEAANLEVYYQQQKVTGDDGGDDNNDDKDDQGDGDKDDQGNGDEDGDHDHGNQNGDHNNKGQDDDNGASNRSDLGLLSCFFLFFML